MNWLARLSLYEVISAFVALLVFFVWIRPQVFPFLLDKGTTFPSLGRQSQYTAMITSTWVLVTATLMKKGDVPEWMFIGYMLAWAGAQFGSLWLKTKGGQAAPTPPNNPQPNSVPPITP